MPSSDRSRPAALAFRGEAGLLGYIGSTLRRYDIDDVAFDVVELELDDH